MLISVSCLFYGWEVVGEGEKITEYTESQQSLSGVHSIMRVKLAQSGEDGWVLAHPLHHIYHHQ